MSYSSDLVRTGVRLESWFGIFWSRIQLLGVAFPHEELTQEGPKLAPAQR